MTFPIISAESDWLLWAIIAASVACSIWLEQKYSWASKMSGAIIALLFAVALTNLGIIPADAPTYDIIWGYVVPLAIPLLLMQCDMKKIFRESGRLLLLFLMGSVGTVAGALIAFFALQRFVPELASIAGMMTGSYIGGGVNFAAMAASFEIPGELVSATTVADNMLMAFYFFVLLAIPSIGFFRKHWKHPHVDEVESKTLSDDFETQAAAYWGRKEISLKDIAFACGISFVIVAVSYVISDFFSALISDATIPGEIAKQFFGSVYLWITTISMFVATVFSTQVNKVSGTQEIGTYLIYLFFFVIGVPASIPLILQEAPLLLVFCAIMVLVNMLVIFTLGKLFKFNLEEIILASNANIGGPTTAAAMAISKGWTQLIGPIMLVGVFGYVIGNYCGLLVGSLLGLI